MGRFHMYCTVCGLGMSYHNGYSVMPVNTIEWWERQRALEAETGALSHIGNVGSYGDFGCNTKRTVREWDSLAVDFASDKQFASKRYTFSNYDDDAARSYQIHSKCVALLVRKLTAQNLSVENFNDWLKTISPITLDRAFPIRDMPDPFDIVKLQEQFFDMFIGKMWILAPFDAPIDFSSTRQLDSDAVNWWKNNINTSLFDSQESIDIARRIFRHGCYNTLALGGENLNVNYNLQKKIHVWVGDITTAHADAVVHPATTCKYTHLKKNRKLDGCKINEVKMTRSVRTNFTNIIHIVTPTNANVDMMKSCYETCFEVIVAKDLQSAVFPRLAADIFTAHDEARIAVEATKAILHENADRFDEIGFCVSEAELTEYNAVIEDLFPMSLETITKGARKGDNNHVVTKLGTLNMDICLQVIEYLDIHSLLQLFGVNRNWQAMGKQCWRGKCREEGFACIPGHEAETLNREDIDWMRMYFCSESRSRRRVNDCVDWIVKSVGNFSKK
ncbi:hypothetical protein HK100_000946 [Physocladia obscura]|uniref:Macro domain-containing protein n=1 Tax=Physocladia obscura TaxID=109957 RepID=A0AAD5TA78_9FUNG|nr:hypothetical protein HK100_000946 [Physocladia obscura]